MYHSLIFVDSSNNSVNTWDDWHLIPSSRPVVVRPTLNYKYVEIPGRDGSLDLTDYLTVTPTMTDCSGSFEFYVANDYGEWSVRKATIGAFLNGRKMKMYLEDDPNYYYFGRFSLGRWTPGENWSSVSIEYRVDPCKYNASTNEKVTA